MWCSAVGFIVMLTLSLLAAPLAAVAQQTTKVHRIGWLSAGFPPAQPRPTVGAFEQTLRDLGYVKGQNLVIEDRYAEGNQERLRDMAAELVRLPVEVLVCTNIAATLAAKAATSTIPIVFMNVPDPVDMGLIASWAQPGGNITGVANAGAEFWTGKLLELLKEVVPAATRIAVLVPVDNPTYKAVGHKALQATARLLKVDLHIMEVRDPATDLERAFAALAHERVDAFSMLNAPSFSPHIPRIVALVAESRLPAIYNNRPYMQAGGLMAYEPDRLAIQRRVGIMVGKILQGAKPADIPAEYPMKFELSINLKTAKALGLTMPPTLLFQADEIIQ